MYNRYIPQGAQYGPIPPEAGENRGTAGGSGGSTGGWQRVGVGSTEGGERVRGGSAAGQRGSGGILGGLLGDRGEEGGGVLSSILKNFHLDQLDTGDILLALIILFLILEDGDNLDLVITLGLMILFSLGES